MARISRHHHGLERALRSVPDLDHFVDSDEMIALSRRHREKFSSGTPTSSSASATFCDDSTATPPNPMRQNAGPIHAFAGFKRLISVIKYQELMPDPFDLWTRSSRGHEDFTP
jgi:hypothetical protein